MITDNTIDKITQVYLNKIPCDNIEQIKAAIKFAVKSTDKIIENKNPDTNTCIKVAEILFKQDFNSIYEVNEWMVKHII